MRTGIRTLSRVGAQVFLEDSALSECSWTQVALEGALARVCAEVVLHVCLGLAHVGALLAGIQLALHGH